jgi:hypothetical protein
VRSVGIGKKRTVGAQANQIRAGCLITSRVVTLTLISITHHSSVFMVDHHSKAKFRRGALNALLAPVEIMPTVHMASVGLALSVR